MLLYSTVTRLGVTQFNAPLIAKTQQFWNFGSINKKKLLCWESRSEKGSKHLFKKCFDELCWIFSEYLAVVFIIYKFITLYHEFGKLTVIHYITYSARLQSDTVMKTCNACGNHERIRLPLAQYFYNQIITVFLIFVMNNASNSTKNGEKQPCEFQ